MKSSLNLEIPEVRRLPISRSVIGTGFNQLNPNQQSDFTYSQKQIIHDLVGKKTPTNLLPLQAATTNSPHNSSTKFDQSAY